MTPSTGQDTSTFHEISLSDEQLRWLVGHTAYEDGIGYDLYRKARNVMMRDAVVAVPPQAIADARAAYKSAAS